MHVCINTDYTLSYNVMSYNGYLHTDMMPFKLCMSSFHLPPVIIESLFTATTKMTQENANYTLTYKINMYMYKY